MLVVGSAVLMTACSGRPVQEKTEANPGSATLADLPGVSLSGLPDSAAPVHDPGDDEKAIGAYRAYLDRYPDSPESERISRRLAELLLASAADIEAQAAVDMDDPGRMQARAQQRYREAARRYAALLERSSGKADRVELLYQLARAYEGAGQARQAITSFDQLLEISPDGNRRLYADACFRRGELKFSDGQFQSAARDYLTVVDMGASIPAYEQALYKLGWSYFRLDDYPAALDTFARLLDRMFTSGGPAETQLQIMSAAQREQLEDVFRAVSMSFAAMSGVDSANDFFDRTGSRSYQRMVYMQLAQYYVEREQVVDAARTWLALADEDPLHAGSPGLYVKAAELYRQAGFRPRLLEVETDFISRYGENSAFWVTHPPSEFEAVYESLQSYRLDLAGYYRQADYRGAEKWYRQYLDAATDEAAATRVNYILAQMLFDNGRYRDAIVEFERTAWSRGEHAQTRVAAEAALLAYSRYLDQLQSPAYDAVLEDATRSAVRYVKRFTRAPEAAQVLGSTGSELLAAGKHREAMAMCREILDDPEPLPAPLLQTVSLVQAQAAYALGDYEQAEAAYRQARVIAAADAAADQSLDKGLASSIYKQADLLRASGDAVAAAQRYMEAADLSDDDAIRPVAWYDAATALVVSGHWSGAIDILERFREQYSGHALYTDATRKLAYACEQDGRGLEAAELYLSLGRGDKIEAVDREALLQAADIFSASGRDGDAISALELYVAAAGRNSSESLESMQRLAELEAARGNAAGRRDWLEQLVRVDRRVGSDRSRWLASHALLELAAADLDSFRDIRLVKPVKNNLARKLEQMKKALAAYQKAIDYGVSPVTRAATFKIASMYEELGRELRGSERPTGLTLEELEQYEQLLNEQAVPFEQKAIELYASTMQGAGHVQDDQWSRKSRQRLEAMQGEGSGLPVVQVEPGTRDAEVAR